MLYFSALPRSTCTCMYVCMYDMNVCEKQIGEMLCVVSSSLY